MRIALFVPCFNDAFFPHTVKATVHVLECLGHQVHVPRSQTCCGQVHFNTGYRREAGRLMQHFLRVFEGAEVVVAPSASCVAMVREQYAELAPLHGGGAWRQRGPATPSEAAGGTLEAEVRALASRTFELSEFLVGKLGVEDVGAVFPYRVTFHPTCHSMRGIQVGDAPLRLLRAVRGLELVELPGALECCGFGGTFSVKNPHTSLAMMDDKLRAVRNTGAEVLAAVDNSCLLHLMGGMRRAGWLAEEVSPAASRASASGYAARPPLQGSVRVMHLAEILASRESA